MPYSNNADLPLSVALWLAVDDYVPNEDIVSATQLLKPTRKLILEHRIKNDPSIKVAQAPVELVDLMKSRKGTAVHKGIETSWLDPGKRKKGLMALGYTEEATERFVVNVEPEHLTKDQIPVYVERYCETVINGFGVGGTADFIINGELTDFKNTTTFNYISPKKDRDYQLQGSIYRICMPKIITKDTMSIVEMYDDWSKASSYSNRYPPQRIINKRIPLLNIPQTRKYITDKTNEVLKYLEADDIDIPLCSDDDLWRSAPQYKYYTKEGNKKSSGNFDTYEEAAAAQRDKGGIGVIKHVKGMAKACNWCDAKPICGQAKLLQANGELSAK